MVSITLAFACGCHGASMIWLIWGVMKANIHKDHVHVSVCVSCDGPVTCPGCVPHLKRGGKTADCEEIKTFFSFKFNVHHPVISLF